MSLKLDSMSGPAKRNRPRAYTSPPRGYVTNTGWRYIYGSISVFYEEYSVLNCKQSYCTVPPIQLSLLTISSSRNREVSFVNSYRSDLDSAWTYQNFYKLSQDFLCTHRQSTDILATSTAEPYTIFSLCLGHEVENSILLLLTWRRVTTWPHPLCTCAEAEKAGGGCCYESLNPQAIWRQWKINHWQTELIKEDNQNLMYHGPVIFESLYLIFLLKMKRIHVRTLI